MSKYTLTISFDTQEELAAYLGTPPTAAAPTTAKADKPTATETKKTPPAKPKPAHTRDEVEAALTQVKDKLGLEGAKKVIKEAGGVEKKAEIPDDKLDAVFAACEAAIAAAEEEAM